MTNIVLPGSVVSVMDQRAERILHGMADRLKVSAVNAFERMQLRRELLEAWSEGYAARDHELKAEIDSLRAKVRHGERAHALLLVLGNKLKKEGTAGNGLPDISKVSSAANEVFKLAEEIADHE